MPSPVRRPSIKHVLLLRHAKSSWENLELADHERPLAPRGRRAAIVMAEHLRRERVRPALVLCSSALRARETLELIAPGLVEQPAIRFERELYAASAERLLERVRAIEDGVECALLIGHNPGLEDLALILAGSGEKLARVGRKYPTGALAMLEFAGHWRELGPGGAKLTDFITPKQLAKQ
jgi:phosphohistidine phosphatase